VKPTCNYAINIDGLKLHMGGLNHGAGGRGGAYVKTKFDVTVNEKKYKHTVYNYNLMHYYTVIYLLSLV
jgi:hypothetical protein